MRAQIQTAVGMILTLTIVAAVLTLGVWGIMAIFDTFGDIDYDRTFDALEEATGSHRSFGSLGVLEGAPPEPFCVFNTTLPDAEKECVHDYSGYELCQAQQAYWKAAGPQDGNVVFESARTERIDRLAPRNGRYACFDVNDRNVFVEGQGSYVTVSPMREIESFRLTYNPTASTVQVAFFTSELESDVPELFYVYNRSVTQPGGYVASGSQEVGGVTFSSLQVSLNADGTLASEPVGAMGSGLESDFGIRVPQLD